MTGSFLIREAFRHLTRSRRLNFISLGSISLALMGLGLTLILQTAIFGLAGFVENKVEVVAFFNDKISPEATSDFLSNLRSNPQVAAAEYHSKADALKEFSQDPALKRFVDALGSNPLPASVRVQLREKTPESVHGFVTWLNEQPGVEETSYGGGDADRLLNILLVVRLAAVILTISLVIAVVIIIGNIISLLVFAQRDEIAIMRMVGATSWFVRGPFLIWGMVQGFVSGLVASGLLYGLWWVLAYYARKEVGVNLYALLPQEAALMAVSAVLGLATTGAVLGLAGSLSSVGKQLRE